MPSAKPVMVRVFVLPLFHDLAYVFLFLYSRICLCFIDVRFIDIR